MRHRVAGKQLSRSSSHRRALRRNMAASLFQHGAIRTTEAKAKELRRFVEKLITTAKKGTLAARRRVIQMLQDREMFSYDEAEQFYLPEDDTVVYRLMNDIAPRYANRDGGYTRIIRLPDRRIGDAGVQVLLQLVEEDAAGDENKAGRRRRRAEKRHDAVKGVVSAASASEQAATPEDTPAEESEPADAADTSSDEAPDEQAPAEEQGEAGTDTDEEKSSD